MARWKQGTRARKLMEDLGIPILNDNSISDFQQWLHDFITEIPDPAARDMMHRYYLLGDSQETNESGKPTRRDARFYQHHEDVKRFFAWILAVDEGLLTKLKKMSKEEPALLISEN